MGWSHSSRRMFIRNCGMLLAAIPGHMGFAGNNVEAFHPKTSDAEPARPKSELEGGFANPPRWVQPWVYWWWLNNRATREGIVRDLDEMQEKGINGVLVFDAGVENAGGWSSEGLPAPIPFMGDEWRSLFRFAVEEASKRGIAVSLNLCSGWVSGGSWITAEEAPQQLVFTKLQVEGPKPLKVKLIEPKHEDPYYRDICVLAYRMDAAGKQSHAGAEPDKTSPWVLSKASVLNLSSAMDSDGILSWQVPSGKWLLLRFGHTVEMPLERSLTKACTPGDCGYELDPLRPGLMDKQFAATALRVLPEVKPWAGMKKTLQYFHIDSWELDVMNWTPALQEEFRRRRGYDLLPYLAAVADETVDSHEITARFLEDFNTTLGDLITENYYGRLAELSHEHGIGTHPESEGPQKSTIDSLRVLGTGDIMMSEFWSRMTEPDGYIWYRSPANLRWLDGIKGASSAAHIYGREIIQAESFTNLNAVDYSDYPFALKDIGDLAFCAGLNRIVFHNYMHQADLDARPGTAWPQVGIKLNRNQTWWNLSPAWIQYLSRCQFIFRKGRTVADVCYFYGEEVPNYVPARENMVPQLPKGFDCDTINAEALLSRMTVKDGLLSLPEGLTYRVLVMPQRPWSMLPGGFSAQWNQDNNIYPGPGNGLPVGVSARVLRKIKDLVYAGATVYGPKPVRAPGLTDYPQCDDAVQRIADELWGTAATASGERNVGKGRVVWGGMLGDLLSSDGIAPDFSYRSDQLYTNLPYIHYSVGDREFYFISNQSLRTERVEGRFRISDSRPELWDPVTGKVRSLPEFKNEKGLSTIPLEFAPRQSFFVVFSNISGLRNTPQKGRKNFPRIEILSEVKGPWEVCFDPKWGGPESITFPELEDWTLRPEEGIRYYSGTATYRRTFDLPDTAFGRRLFLDLGIVEYIASVRLNGKDQGVVWTAPWHIDITDSARRRGNQLEIDVVNLWTNRMIGDLALPEAERFTKTNVPTNPDWQLFASGLLGPVTIRTMAEL